MPGSQDGSKESDKPNLIFRGRELERKEHEATAP